MLTDARLTLDVYRAGAAALPVLWRFVPGQLLELQYLRLGSEDDEQGLEEALSVIPYLTRLRSLAVRGTQSRHLQLLLSKIILEPLTFGDLRVTPKFKSHIIPLLFIYHS